MYINTDHLYKFSNNTTYKQIYTWAYSIIPRSEMVAENCEVCGHISKYVGGAFDVICEGGGKYPDILGCGAYPFTIVSERVIEAWTQADISNFHTFPVSVASIKARRLTKGMAPPYYRVEIEGKCRIDTHVSGFDMDAPCSKCGRRKYRTYDLAHCFKMVLGSWDGSPLFRDELQFPRVSFCTQVMLDTAQAKKLNNFRFLYMQEQENVFSKGIDYMRGER